MVPRSKSKVRYVGKDKQIIKLTILFIFHYYQKGKQKRSRKSDSTFMISQRTKMSFTIK